MAFIVRMVLVAAVISACITVFGTTQAVADQEITAHEAVDVMLEAARDARAGVRTVIAKGWFKKWDIVDEQEPRLKTSGRFLTYVDGEEYHIRFTYEMMNGMNGWKPDHVFIVKDGRDIKSAIFSPRFKENVFRSEHKHFNEAGSLGGTIVNPAHVTGGLVPFEATVKSLGKEALRVSTLPGEGFRVTYRKDNTPKMNVELDAFMKDDFNISVARSFLDGQEEPERETEATWKKIDGHWVVTELTSEHLPRRRGESRLPRTREPQFKVKEVVGYDSIELNRKVDRAAFTADSMNPDWKPNTESDETE